MRERRSSDLGTSPLERHRPISVRLPNDTIATLQFLAAGIRRSTGAAIRLSAIVRGLVTWLAESRIDPGDVSSAEDLQRSVQNALSPARRGDGSGRRSAQGRE